MKILCMSDTHGERPIEFMGPDVPDIVLHAGDFYNMLGRKDFNNYNKKEDLIDWHISKSIKFRTVKGNHDCYDAYNLFDNEEDVTGKVERISDNLILVGIGWSGKHFYDLPRESDIEKVCHEVERRLLIEGRLKDEIIVLTHYPPQFNNLYKFGEENTEPPPGWLFKSIASLCEAINPKIIIQGHVHEFFGLVTEYKNSLIISPGPSGMLIDTINMKIGIPPKEK